ncbi:MAG: sialidase family protein [Acidimicrobiales bacterium]
MLGTGLVVVAIGLLVLASSASGGTPAAVGPATGINEHAGDPRDITAHNSPELVRNPVDPANFVVASRIDLPRYSCALHASFDGGATWEAASIPFPAGEEDPPRCYAPDVAFDSEGELYAVFTTLAGLGNTPNATWITSSHDGGRTLATPTKALGPLAFQSSLTSDPRRAGRLYLSWLQATEVATLGFAGTGNPINIARSDDGGRTWLEPIRVSPPYRQRVVAPSFAVGSGGALLVTYLDLGDDRLDYAGAHLGTGGEPYGGTWSLVVARSDDGGGTWTETTVDSEIVPAQRIVVFIPPMPSLAVDAERGLVYVAFADARSGDPDVLLWRSSDGGATFARGRRVNDTVANDGTSQYLATVAVAPTGRLDVAYYDRRNDRSDAMNSVSFQSSFDHGRNFKPSLRLTPRPFDSRVGFGSERGMADLGSRLGLVSTDDHALAVWTDTGAGTEVSGKQDLHRAVVAIAKSASSLRTPLRVASWAVVTMAALVLGAAHRKRLNRPGFGRGSVG